MADAPCLPGLFSPGPRRMADTSLLAFEHILPTLNQRERAVLLALCDAGQPVTGGELAEQMGLPVTSIRPRLTALCDSGLAVKQPARMSRAAGESFAHPYLPAVSKAAVERVK